MRWLVLIAGDFGPYPDPEFSPAIEPYIAVTLAGFAIGILGHVYRSRVMVGVGVFTIFAGTLLLPLAVYLLL